MKIQQLFENDIDSNNPPTLDNNLKGKIQQLSAEAAQKVYDEWDENPDEYFEGGICHLIADEICNKLMPLNIYCTPLDSSVGENHTFVIAKFSNGVFSIDIDPHVYETGSAYTWNKIPDVQFFSDDVNIFLVHTDPNKFDEEYFE